jgi:hypothetical protein
MNPQRDAGVDDRPQRKHADSADDARERRSGFTGPVG